MSFLLGLTAISACIAAWVFFYSKPDFVAILKPKQEMVKIFFYCSVGLAITGTILFEPKMSAASLMFSTWTVGVWMAKRALDAKP